MLLLERVDSAHLDIKGRARGLGLPTDHRVNVQAARHLDRHLRLLPRLPAIVTHVHLSALGAAVHVCWRGPVNGNLGHTARWGLPYSNALPGLTGVTAAEQRSGLLGTRWRAAATGACRQVDDLGVIWCHQQAATVGAAREHLVDRNV